MIPDVFRFQTPQTLRYAPPPVDRREILRYAGCREASAAVAEALDACLAEALPALDYRACCCVCPVVHTGDALDLGFAVVPSDDLKKNLAGCDRALLFAATIGLGIDRLIARECSASPARALLLQAIGAERIEALADLVNADARADAQRLGLAVRPRFSPGYGDLPLALQREVFAALDCPRRIGLTLSGSLLMSPTKSVTALIGAGPA
jgi:hypothetical protein